MISPDDAREALKRLTTAHPADADVVDRYAAALRDQMVAFDHDPADRVYLEGVYLGAVLALSVIQQGFCSPNIALGLVHQAETLRRMLDGETPILSAEDMLHLPGAGQ